VLKVVLPLIFVLLADGKLAGGATDKGVATDRSPVEEKGGAKDEKGKEAEGHAAKDAHGEGAAKEAAGHGEAAKDAHGEAGKPATIAKAGAKPAAHPGKKGDKAGDKPGDKAEDKSGLGGIRDPGRDPHRTPTPGPTISSTAMNDEMARMAGQQKALSERERLEALSNDLSRTRSALREETVRLETMMEAAKHAPKPAAAPPAAKPASAEGARPEGGPMPLGDPLAPNAYYRPAPPPPNFAIQVEVVSKAMKSMKPEQAAGILGHLERGLAAEVLQRMRPADAGAILGFLKPEVGAALAAEIVSRPPVGRGSKDKDADKEKP
jgi:hypothetical protein